MKSQDIRKAYLQFFESKGHTIVPSAPIVLKNDPTLMFNNSGMAQFKEFFLGNRTPKSTKAFELAQSSCNPKARSAATAAVATPPSANNFVTLTGSVTEPVMTRIATNAEPIPSTRAIVLSAT